MAEIKKVYRQSMPKMKLVGKCYKEEDKVNNTFAAHWCEWFQNDWFSPLRLAGSGSEEPFEDCDALIGLSRLKEGEPFQYWIGVFMPMDAAVPAGYDSVALEAGDIAVCWIYGKEPDIYFHCCLDRLKEEGFSWGADKDGVRWCFERYVCPRFTQPDERGNVILDMCFYLGADK